jgi:hypothetical protein
MGFCWCSTEVTSQSFPLTKHHRPEKEPMRPWQHRTQMALIERVSAFERRDAGLSKTKYGLSTKHAAAIKRAYDTARPASTCVEGERIDVLYGALDSTGRYGCWCEADVEHTHS